MLKIDDVIKLTDDFFIEYKGFTIDDVNVELLDKEQFVIYAIEESIEIISCESTTDGMKYDFHFDDVEIDEVHYRGLKLEKLMNV